MSITNRCCVSLLMAAAACVVQAGEESWNQWRGPQRNGAIASNVPLRTDGKLPLLWDYSFTPSLLSGGYSSPAIAGDRVVQFFSWRGPVKPTAVRLHYGSLIRQGWYEGTMPDALQQAVEAARMSPERKPLATSAAPAWAMDWITKHLDADQRSRWGETVYVRLVLGANAVDLNSREKLAAGLRRIFASNEEVAAWLRKIGIPERAADRIQEDLPEATQVSKDTVVCLDAKTGAEIWRKQWPAEMYQYGTSSTPCVVEGKVYVQGDRTMYCLDLKDGREIWKTTSPGHEASSSPLVVDGVVVVSGGIPVAYDAETGKELWRQPDVGGEDIRDNSFTFWRKDGRTVVLGHFNDLMCLDLKTGRKLWQVPSGGGSTPVVAEDIVVSGWKAYPLSFSKPAQLWSANFSGSSGTPVVYNGLVFRATETNNVSKTICLDLKTGAVVCERKGNVGGCMLIPSPIVADGRLYMESRDGMVGKAHFFVFRADKTLEPLGKILIPEVGGWWRCSSPAISGGRFYTRTGGGLQCLDLRAQTATK